MAATARAQTSAFGRVLAARLKGAEDAFLDGSTIVIAGVKFTKQALIDKYKSLLAAYEEVEALRALLERAIADRDLLAQATSNFVEYADLALKGYFGPDSAALRKFDLRQRAQPMQHKVEAKVVTKTPMCEAPESGVVPDIATRDSRPDGVSDRSGHISDRVGTFANRADHCDAPVLALPAAPVAPAHAWRAARLTAWPVNVGAGAFDHSGAAGPSSRSRTLTATATVRARDVHDLSAAVRLGLQHLQARRR